MTTATRSRITYLVWCGPYIVDQADDRESAEEKRDLHAARNNNDPLSDRYRIIPERRKEQE